MSVTTEINRIKKDKEDIRNALNYKMQLSIPSDASLDTFTSEMAKVHPYGVGLGIAADYYWAELWFEGIEFFAKLDSTGEYKKIGETAYIMEEMDYYYYSAVIYWPDEPCQLFFRFTGGWEGEHAIVHEATNSTYWGASVMADIINSFDKEFDFDANGNSPYMEITRNIPSQKTFNEFSWGWGGLFLDMRVSVPHACLFEDTQIKTDNGLFAIKDLKEGMQINNEFGTIEKVAKHERAAYYNITLSDDSVIKATHDHKFIMDEDIVKQTVELSVGDKFSNGLQILKIDKIDEKVDMYEIKTTSNKYELFNGVVCECENI